MQTLITPTVVVARAFADGEYIAPETVSEAAIVAAQETYLRPVTGDALYGAPCPLLPDRFALHAWRAALTQPFTGARIDVRAPLPEGFAALALERGEGTL